MEVKIYDKDGNVIATDSNTEGNKSQGHYDIDLSDQKKSLQFVKNSSKNNSPKKKL